MSSKRTKILLDTDIGSDIDDAVCLAYLLAQPLCELVGITTVTGDTQKRAMLADALCRVAGKEVPIRAGRSEVLLYGPGQADVPQAAVLPDLKHSGSFGEDAIDFMRATIRGAPGEITLLAVGPLTNVASLFAADPQLPSLLHRTVLMNGVFLRQGAEWNSRCDPIASALVFRHLHGANLSVGLDVTGKCSLPAEEVRARFTGPLLQTVSRMAEVWFRRARAMTFHDPLAAAVLFAPYLCHYASGTITVDVHSRQLEGATLWRPARAEEQAPHAIATDVDPGAFFEHFFAVMAADPLA